MIQPTIGRAILVFNRHANAKKDQPEAATIAFVHNDRQINVSGTDHYGMAFAMHDLRLVQEGEQFGDWEPHAEWMPYQKAVAKGEILATLHAAPPVDDAHVASGSSLFSDPSKKAP